MVFGGGDLGKRSYSLLLTVAVTCAITFILLLILGVYFFGKLYRGASTGVEQKTAAVLQADSGLRGETVSISGGDKEVGETVKKVSRHVLLPEGKVTVTTVMDPDGLRSNVDARFYARAEKGDKVLFYSDRAILYNPTLDLVLEMAYVRTAGN